MNPKWIRVTRAVRCSQCHHPDWCTFCPELSLSCCMRISSSRPSRNGGFFHPIGDAPKRLPSKPEPVRPTIDAAKMMRDWFTRTTREAYARLAKLIGVSVESLVALKCGWAMEHRAWAWPMRNGSGMVVGIRLRSESGHKWSVRGGREGVFLPSISPQETIWIAEGPTDTAALITLGKFAAGRPSCSGGIAHLSATIARLGIKRAVIVSDNDHPGLDGAVRLSNDIGVPCCIVVLPCKDCREAVALGITSDLLDSFTSGVVWTQPNRPTSLNAIHGTSCTEPNFCCQENSPFATL